jgi:hypothetical protein
VVIATETETDKLVKKFIVEKVKSLQYEKNFKKTCEFLNRENPIDCEKYFEKMKKLFSIQESDKIEEFTRVVSTDTEEGKNILNSENGEDYFK